MIYLILDTHRINSIFRFDSSLFPILIDYIIFTDYTIYIFDKSKDNRQLNLWCNWFDYKNYKYTLIEKLAIDN